jgi:ubiquinone/menaquinone biosynthesis C-methylase UbiE
MSNVWDRLTEGVCRRSFSSPEAFLYESLIARGLCRLVAPAIVPHVVDGRVLDVGCGGGSLAALIAGQRDCAVVGVDPSSAQMTRLGRHRGVERVFGARASAMALPFATARFGTVVSSCAFKHWPDTELGLAECMRVARTGGSIVIVEIDGSASVGDVRLLAEQLALPAPIRSGYVRFAMRTVVGVAPRPEDIRSCLISAGAADVELHRIDRSPLTLCVGRRA